MNPDRKILILAAISIAAIVVASVSATIALLPKSDTVTLPAARTVDTLNIAHNASDLPQRRTSTNPQNVAITLYTVEIVAEIDSGETYRYWTFNRTVPGPMLRVMKGDNVTITIVNPANSTRAHSIDLHAVIGPGGGATLSDTPVGQSTTFKFKATREGLYVYHCATTPVPEHIAHGMYGLILVEDPANLPPVGPTVKEFYVMQGDFYSVGKKGQDGHHDFDYDEMLSENPDYVVFNGKVGSLVGIGNALTADVDEKVRIYFGVGGPNLVSSFHIIGEIFDRVYPEGSLSTFYTFVQTTLVPGGGSAIVEFTPEIAGDKYWLVDHSLARALEKGAAGQLIVSGTSHEGVYGF